MKQDLFSAVILAGGLATRLRPLTETIPKSLVEVGGEPFVNHQLRLLKNNGIQRVVMCVGYLGEQIVAAVGNGAAFGLDVVYSFDGPTLLGTAGAIKKALNHLDECFFVFYGDSYLPCCYHSIQQTFLQSQKLALMSVYYNQGKWDKSNVVFDGTIKIYDKKNVTPEMQYIDYGLGIFNKKIFHSLPENQAYDLAILYQDMLAAHQLAAHEVKQRFYEIGSFTGIADLEAHLSSTLLTT